MYMVYGIILHFFLKGMAPIFSWALHSNALPDDNQYFHQYFFSNRIRVKDDRCLICWRVHQKHRRGSAVDVLTLTWNLKELSSMNAHLAVPVDPFLWPSERNIDGIHAKNPYSMLTYLISSDPHFNPVKDRLYHFYFLKPGAIKWLTYVNTVNG